MESVAKLWRYSEEEEYLRNERLKQEEITSLREWLEKQSHLPQLTDHQLMIFLSACNYSIENTKTILDLNLTFKTMKSEFFGQRDPLSSEIKKAAQQIKIAVMPEKDDDNNIVIIQQLQKFPASEFDPFAVFKLGLMVQEMTFLDMGVTNGHMYVTDDINVTIPHIMKVPLSATKDYLKYIQECNPSIIRGVHITNGGIVLEKAMTLARPFLKKGVLQLIHVHNSNTSLQKHVPPKCLPSDFGGEGLSLSEIHDLTIEKLTTYRDWFLEEEKQRVDETKRFTPSSFGMQGSFKKLDID